MCLFIYLFAYLLAYFLQYLYVGVSENVCKNPLMLSPDNILEKHMVLGLVAVFLCAF